MYNTECQDDHEMETSLEISDLEDWEWLESARLTISIDNGIPSKLEVRRHCEMCRDQIVSFYRRKSALSWTHHLSTKVKYGGIIQIFNDNIIMPISLTKSSLRSICSLILTCYIIQSQHRTHDISYLHIPMAGKNAKLSAKIF